MKKPNLEKVQIVEPPIQELTKRNRPWTRGLLLGLVGLIISAAAAALGLRLFIGKGAVITRNPPTAFPSTIPLYDRDSISRVVFTSGVYRYRTQLIANLLPAPLHSLFTQFFVAPALTLDPDWPALPGYPDTIRIEWKNMTADPDFVFSYYEKNLTGANYTVEVTEKKGPSRKLTFKRPGGGAGMLTVEGVKRATFTPRATLIVQVPR
ncbi:MAG: hypothetical protein HYV42_02770 [Candidatus Magasanikbacteria bacterium]|nr:hypothetical protein [Candidatus Magasanikbacteria bacterium]